MTKRQNRAPRIKMDRSTIKERYLGLTAVNQWAPHVSSARGIMFLGQWAQPFVLNNPEPRLIPSGIERQLATNTFNISILEEFMVNNIITSGETNDIEEVSIIMLVGINIRTGEAECYELPIWFSLSPSYGFRYKRNKDLLESISPGMVLEKGIILADSPGVVDDTYGWGINANILYANFPGSGQDGMLVHENLLKKMEYNIFISGYLEYGAESYPLNMYGDLDNYKAFPEVGESIGEDNVFGVIRTFDKDTITASISRKDAMEYNPEFDRPYYLKPTKYIGNENDAIVNNKVVQVRYVHSPKNKRDTIYNHVQTERNVQNNIRFCKAIVKSYESLKKETKNYNLLATPRFHSKIKNAKYFERQKEDRITFKFKNDPVDIYRVEFTVQYTVRPSIGSKISNMHGGKGIIVGTMNKENESYDKYGNIIELIIDPTSVPSRMNPAALYEAYQGGVAVNTRRILKEYMGEHPSTLSAKKIDTVFEKYKQYQRLTSEETYEVLKEATFEDKLECLTEVWEKGLYTPFKISGKPAPDVVLDLEDSEFKLPKERIYIQGKLSKEKHSIGNAYIMLLSKTAEGYLATASSHVNHYNIPARVNQTLKSTKPYIHNPTKVYSETERRLFANYNFSPVLPAELHSRAGDLKTHTEIYRNLLKAVRPSALEHAVDREKVPLGGDAALNVVSGIFKPFGIQFTSVKGRK